MPARRSVACAIRSVLRMSIAEALTDQRALAGIGNVYKSEILFIERVSPFAEVGSLTDETLARLVATGERLLRANVENGRGPERVTTTGDRRATGPLYVYGRSGRPCRRCGTRIDRARQGTELPRLTFWCPTCQPATPKVAAYHRARCVSNSSLGRASRSGCPSSGRSPSASSGTGSPASAGAPAGPATTARSTATATCEPSATTRRREALGSTETRAALVHLRRPSKLSTLTGPDTQPFDDPAGRYAFSHNGDLRDYRQLRATLPGRGPDPRPGRHRGRRPLARGRLGPGRATGPPPGRAPRHASAARPISRS